MRIMNLRSQLCLPSTHFLVWNHFLQDPNQEGPVDLRRAVLAISMSKVDNSNSNDTSTHPRSMSSPEPNPKRMRTSTDLQRSVSETLAVTVTPSPSQGSISCDPDVSQESDSDSDEEGENSKEERDESSIHRINSPSIQSSSPDCIGKINWIMTNVNKSLPKKSKYDLIPERECKDNKFGFERVIYVQEVQFDDPFIRK